MIYLRLFYEFFKIGLFAIGGGMATIPFLQDLANATGWYNQDLITDMIAISESTPGPIGINMATYVGYNVAGFFGGVVATLGEIAPSIIIVVLLSKSLDKYANNKYVKYAFYALRAAATGLIAAAAISVIEVSILNLELFNSTHNIIDIFHLDKFIYFIIMLVAILKLKKHPITYIAFSAIIGILFQF